MKKSYVTVLVFIANICITFVKLDPFASSPDNNSEQCCETPVDLKDVLSRVQSPPVVGKSGDKKSSQPALINVSLHVETMRDIASEVTLDFYIIQKWFDHRLKEQIENITENVKISGQKRPDVMWYPDTYFQLVHSLIYSAEEQSVEFFRDGSVEYIRKVRLVTPCSPNVLLFPFDIVNCSLQLSSFGNTIEDVRYVWDVERTENAVLVDPDNNDGDHLGFDVLPTRHNSSVCQYGPDGFSCLKAFISLKRYFSAYMLQVYAPAFLLVVLSWLSFWVNIKATPARASLSVTTVLSILTLATRSATQNQKHVSGKVTALDIYVYVCFGFVILAMLEFSLSDFVASNRAANSGSQKKLDKNFEGRKYKSLRTIMEDGENVNKAARIVLPVSFAIFNILYWLILVFGAMRQT